MASRPVVMFAIAGAASAAGHEGATGPGGALLELPSAPPSGSAAGPCSAVPAATMASEQFAGIAVLALAVLAYTAALLAHGDGFVAAFCGGLAFGAVAGRRGPTELQFLEQVSGTVSLHVWLAFGAVAVPIMIARFDVAIVLHAVLSLTVVRMIPVALALIGRGFDRNTVLFVVWSGPRRLASLVFALLALEELGTGADQAVDVIALTVLLSVIAHGVSAAPLARPIRQGGRGLSNF